MIQINELIKEAMHNKNMQCLNTLKLIKAEFLKKQTEPNRKTKELSEEEQIKVLMKMAAERKDSIEQYEKAGRSDLADKEIDELVIITSFLPKEPTEAEIIQVTKETVDNYKKEKGEDYALSMKDMKEIMSIVKSKFPTANGGVISKTFKEIITK